MNKQITLAIIDDFAPKREQLRKFLQSAGISVAFDAENGVECLKKLAACDRLPDICILDIEMPLMNGFETAQHIKTWWPEVRIIMHSLSADDLTIKKAIQSGADLFLSKNCEPSELLAAVCP